MHERIPSSSISYDEQEEQEQEQSEINIMNINIVPSSEDSRTICSSSFIVTEQPIIIPTVISTSLSIANENSIHQDNSRLVIE